MGGLSILSADADVYRRSSSTAYTHFRMHFLGNINAVGERILGRDLGPESISLKGPAGWLVYCRCFLMAPSVVSCCPIGDILRFSRWVVRV